jgi:hypothetical protein
MSSIPMLPPELWTMIVELALEDSVNPQTICDHSNFLQLRHHLSHLRSPKTRPPIYNSWSNIRLVSQAFKVFAGPSPYFVMKKDDIVIPRSARAVYITSGPNSLSRLLDVRCNTHQIVALDTANGFLRNSTDERSSAFLRYAAIFPNLRSLTLHLLSDSNEISFWGRLNEAFPSLTCLVLTGRLRAAAEEAVIFEKLEILDIDCQLPSTGVHFPALRHASIKFYEMVRVTRWHGLESLLVRNMETDASLDWTQFPKLRFLGLPTSHLWVITRCPRDHPFSELCIFVPGLALVETTIERLTLNSWAAPKARIHITSKNVTQWETRMLADACDFPGLELVGVPHHRLRRDLRLFGSLGGISFVMLLLCIAIWDLLN